jgi:hypothetical protein
MRKSASPATNGVLRIIVLVALGLALVGYVAYQEYSSVRLQMYFDNADSVTRPMNQSLAIVNRDIDGFRGDEKTRRKILAELERAKSAATTAGNRLRDINPPGKAAAYHRNLTKLVADSRIFLDDLSGFFTYLGERNNVVTKFAANVSTFSERLKTASDDLALLELFHSLQNQTDQLRKSLTDLPRPKIQIYSDSTLDRYLTETSTALAQLQTSISSQDSSAAQAAASNLRTILNRDWQSALVVSDPAGIAGLVKREKALGDLQNLLARNRSKI